MNEEERQSTSIGRLYGEINTVEKKFMDRLYKCQLGHQQDMADFKQAT